VGHKSTSKLIFAINIFETIIIGVLVISIILGQKGYQIDSLVSLVFTLAVMVWLSLCLAWVIKKLCQSHYCQRSGVKPVERVKK
jgi:hypothetical protein